jgi:hypothetical protein
MGGKMWVGKTRRLLAENRLTQLTVQECVLDIQLVDGPILRGGDGEEQTDGRRLDDGAKRVPVVHAGLLIEATHDPTRFVAR